MSNNVAIRCVHLSSFRKELEKLTTTLERQKAANEESEEQFLTARYEKMAEMKREKEELEEQMKQKQKDWDQEKSRVQEDLHNIRQQKRDREFSHPDKGQTIGYSGGGVW